MKTLKNKIVAVLLILGGWITYKLDNDATVLLMMIMFGVPTFFAKEDVITF